MKKNQRIIIVGAGDAGRALFDEYVRRGKASSVVGFADDDLTKIGTLIYDREVLCPVKNIQDVIRERSITQVDIAIPSAGTEVINRIVTDSMAADSGISIHIIPAAEKFFDTVPLLPSLQDFPFAEFFGRDEYSIDIGLIRRGFAGKTVLITGAGGSIGSELCRQMLKFDVKTIVALGRGEHSIYTLAKSMNEYIELMDSPPQMIYRIVDVKDAILLYRVFRQFQPDIVFHAAAHKHVPLMEFNEIEALQNNVAGTRNVLECASAHGVERFILVSTDKAVRPANIMGATKRMAELLTGHYHLSRKLKTAVVRFGNVIGSRGSVIPLFREQIEKGGPVTVTHPEVKRYFMSIPEAALLVVNAAAFSAGGEVFVLNMGEQYKVVDIATRLIELYGFKPGKDIAIEFTGLRPGEKLYEELFYDTALLAATGNEKIFTLRDTLPADGALGIDSLIKKLASNSEEALTPREIRKQIRDIVPEYEYSDDFEDPLRFGKIVN